MPSQAPPDYKVYRSRPRLFSRADRPPGARPGRGGADRPPRRRRITRGRVAGWLALAVLAWVGVSLLAFLVSAQIEQARFDGAADAALGGAGYPLADPNTVLVLGSDTRNGGTAEPGAQTSGPGRADSILLVRVGGGENSRMSIARDTLVDIPGHGRQKINAAYALGGPALMTETVERYTGVDVHHVIQVSFAEFPRLIDAMGGVNYRGGCVVSRINGGFRNGGYTLRLPAGKTRIDGRQALALARTRKNECNPNEDDLTRARRQQKIVAAIKRRMLSPGAFVRLPVISWQAPRTFRTDMSGPTLLGVFAAMAVGGSPDTRVLGTVDGNVPEELRQRRVREFLR